MKPKLPLQELIKTFETELETIHFSEFYLNQLKVLLTKFEKFSQEAGYEYWSEDLAESFLNSSTVRNEIPPVNTVKSRKLLVDKLKLFVRTGDLNDLRSIKETEEDLLPADFKNRLKVYDENRLESDATKDSINRDRRVIVHVLFYFSQMLKRNSLQDVKAGDTIRAIEWILETKYQPSSLATALSGLRKFYRIHPELNPYIVEIPSRIQKERKIIETFTTGEEAALLTSLKSGKLSRRNTAIGLLMLETGLRGTDIVSLQLQDIDWEHNCINIIQSKTKRTLTLPLSPVVGNALIEYLLNERPRLDTNTVFLTLRSPHRPLKSVFQITALIARKAGIDPKAGVGPRAFRHSAATRMLNEGTPLPLIAQKLGHSSPDTTMIYLNTDRTKMAALTLALPEAIL